MAFDVIFSGYKVSWCSLHFISMCSDVVKIDMSSAAVSTMLATIFQRKRVVFCLKSHKEEEGTNFIFNLWAPVASSLTLISATCCITTYGNFISCQPTKVDCFQCACVCLCKNQLYTDRYSIYYTTSLLFIYFYNGHHLIDSF